MDNLFKTTKKIVVDDWASGELYCNDGVYVLSLNMISTSYIKPLFFIASHFHFLDAEDLEVLSYMFKTDTDIIKCDGDWYHSYDYRFCYKISVNHLKNNEIKYSIYIYQDNFYHIKHFRNRFHLDMEENFEFKFFNFNLMHRYVVGCIYQDDMFEDIDFKEYTKINQYQVLNLFTEGFVSDNNFPFTADFLINTALKEIPDWLLKKDMVLFLAVEGTTFSCRLRKIR